MKFTYTPTPVQLEKVTAMAQLEGVDIQTWMTQTMQEAVERVTGRRDLTIREAANELRVSPETARRYFVNRRFPKAYQVNARVIRVPASDVALLKQQRGY